MALTEEWKYSYGSRLFGLVFLSAVIGVLALSIWSIELANAVPRPTTTTIDRSEVAGPTTTTIATQSESCDIVIIEAIFRPDRTLEVIGKGERLGVVVETYEQSDNVTVAYIRIDSESERTRIFEIVTKNGWSDAYPSVLQPPNCEETA